MPSVLSNKRAVISTTILIAFIIWSLIVSIIGIRDSTTNYLYNLFAPLLYFWGAFTAFRAIPQLQFGSAIGKVVATTGSALILFAMGDLVWACYVLFLKTPVPYPSLADIFFTLYVPTLILAFVYLLTAFKATLTLQKIVETLLFSVATFAIIFFALIRPEIPNDGLTLKTFFDIIYPLGDVLILSMAFLAFRIAGDKIRTTITIFITATIVEAVADITFSKTTGSETYFNGSYVDVLFLLSAWFLTLGVTSIIQNFTSTSSLPRTASQT